MYYRFSLTLIILFLINHLTFAQIDKEFWFVAPEVTNLHADRPVYLRFQSYDKPATIEVTIPASNTLIQTFTLQAGSFQSINITPYINQIENTPPNTVLNKGICIKSSYYISVYYEVYGSTASSPGVNCDIFVLKGRHALGTDFATPFQQTFENYPSINAYTTFDIVATEDNTIVEIIPQNAIYGYGPFSKIKITLNKGQTWSGRSIDFQVYNKPVGTQIKSNKPIAVTVKDDSMVKGLNYDLGGDQIIPKNKLGTKYIAMHPDDPMDYQTNIVSVMAITNNTHVNFGSTSYLLNKYESIDLPITEPTLIESDLPISVLQTAGFKNELGQSILPPINCTGSKNVGFVRSNKEPFVLNILAPKGSLKHFFLNNTPVIDSILFIKIPLSNGEWYQYSKSFNTNEINVNVPYFISNNTSYFQLSIMNGNIDSTGFRMGYFSDYGFVDLGNNKTICLGDTINLDAGPFMDSYLWTPNGELSNEIVVSDSGLYSVQVTKQQCTFTDSIYISYPPKVDEIITYASDTVCLRDTVTLKANSNFKSFEWSNNSKDSISIFNATTTGDNKYSLIALDEYNCKYYDTTDVYVRELPSGQITLSSPSIEEFCHSSIKTLTAPNKFSYHWYTGETTQSITYTPIAETNVYVQLTDSNNCSNTIYTTVDCTIYINVPNLISRNGDGKNDLFIVEGLIPNTYTFELYSIYGKLVYKELNYNNTWKPNDTLSPGIYYVHLKHYNNIKNYKGWLHIID